MTGNKPWSGNWRRGYEVIGRFENLKIIDNVFVYGINEGYAV